MFENVVGPHFHISHNFTDLLSVYFLMDSQNAIGFGLVLTLAAINQGTRYSDVDVFLDGFVSDADILTNSTDFQFLFNVNSKYSFNLNNLFLSALEHVSL